MVTTPVAPAGHKTVRTPTVLQMEVTECGAASLTMILNWLGLDVLLEEVRERCAVSRDGVNALKMVDAARSFGLETTGYRYDADEIGNLEAPFVVFWNQNHFLDTAPAPPAARWSGRPAGRGDRRPGWPRNTPPTAPRSVIRSVAAAGARNNGMSRRSSARRSARMTARAAAGSPACSRASWATTRRDWRAPPGRGCDRCPSPGTAAPRPAGR